jgi:hypothetical protein
MFQSLSTVTLRRFAAALVASVIGILCAQADASCGNYLHTRNGGPPKTADNLQAGMLSNGQMADQGLRLILVLSGPSEHPAFPVPPCSGPFCRQSPDGPVGAVLDPVQWNSLLKFAAGAGRGVCFPALAFTRRAVHGTAKLQAGFPPGIDIPPELAPC